MGDMGDRKIRDYKKIGDSYKKTEAPEIMSPDGGSFQLILGSRLAFVNDVRC